MKVFQISLRRPVVVVFLMVSCCVVSGDVDCSKCLELAGFSGCADQACQNADGQCFIGTRIDPETNEQVNVYEPSRSYKLVHLNDPKACGPKNSAIAADGADCVGEKEYICYKKLSYGGLGCGASSCEEFSTWMGCSITVAHHGCLVIP